MEKTVHVVCDECMQMVDAPVQEFSEVQPMRGLDLDVTFEWPVCPNCGNKIAVGTYAEENDIRLYDAYRKATGMPNGNEIRALRERLGLSQKKLADLLGIGVASIQRYEGGSLPTEAHAAMIRRLSDPVFLKQRLLDASFASEKERSAMAASVEQAISKQEEDRSLNQTVLMMVQRVPNRFTGDRAFDAERFRQVLVYFAQHITELYRTKLNKALFYLDFASYRDFGRGVTGLRYAKADYGPVPDKYEQLIAAFTEDGGLYYDEQDNGGQILRTRDEEARLDLFSPNERKQLMRVVEFINGFDTATALTRVSHEELAWQRPQFGELLSYEGASALKAIPPMPREERHPVEFEPFSSEDEALEFTTRMAMKEAFDEEG